jgi:Putative prokaryotic signal transducing protein
MGELLRSNDAVLIGFAQSVLRQAGIASFVADQYMSVVEGSIGAFPRRLQVGNADWAAARLALRDAGLEAWLVEDGEAPA